MLTEKARLQIEKLREEANLLRDTEARYRQRARDYSWEEGKVWRREAIRIAEKLNNG